MLSILMTSVQHLLSQYKMVGRRLGTIKKISNKAVLSILFLLMLIYFFFKTVWQDTIVAHPLIFLSWGADSTGNVYGRESFWYMANYITAMTSTYLVPLLKFLIMIFGMEVIKRILLNNP